MNLKMLSLLLLMIFYYLLHYHLSLMKISIDQLMIKIFSSLFLLFLMLISLYQVYKHFHNHKIEPVLDLINYHQMMEDNSNLELFDFFVVVVDLMMLLLMLSMLMMKLKLVIHFFANKLSLTS
ncbi:hypothetical protein AQUCO_03000406v1 [Aquilegia coerulea]|uniref:Uncharacterized protein n=1 Tax=Aquilegia coerulea TaxID=218851 RepID=A0A2G5D2W1_AQUCA|nr:hypothetical protein AQUCO_03000406v1 [Aquilegia coerulea]